MPQINNKHQKCRVYDKKKSHYVIVKHSGPYYSGFTAHSQCLSIRIINFKTIFTGRCHKSTIKTKSVDCLTKKSSFVIIKRSGPYNTALFRSLRNNLWYLEALLYALNWEPQFTYWFIFRKVRRLVKNKAFKIVTR